MPVLLRAVLVVLLLATGLVACSDGGPTRTTPEGFTSHTVEDFTFAYPEDWSVSEETGADGTVDFEAAGPQGDNGAPSNLTVSYDEREVDLSFEERYSLSKTSLRDAAPGFEQLAERDLEIPGAEAARLLSLRFTTSQGARSTGHAVIAVTPEGHGVLLRLAGPEDVVTNEMVESVIDSLYFTG